MLISVLMHILFVTFFNLFVFQLQVDVVIIRICEWTAQNWFIIKHKSAI